VTEMKVGVIGLGKMGGPIAGHIARGKFPTFGFDANSGCCQRAAERGVKVCPDLSSLGR